MRNIGIITLLMATIILTGCTEQETVLDLEIRPVLFDGYHHEPDQPLTPLNETEQIAVHTICDETGAISLPNRAFVYDGTYRSFSHFSSDTASPMTSMTVFHDDEATYASCQTGTIQYMKPIDPEHFSLVRREVAAEPPRPRSLSEDERRVDDIFSPI